MIDLKNVPIIVAPSVFENHDNINSVIIETLKGNIKDYGYELADAQKLNDQNLQIENISY